MKKIVLILVLVVGLFGSENKNTDTPIMKHETKIKNGIGTCIFIINSKKMGLNQHKFNTQGLLKYDSNYVSHISATIDNIFVFDAELSPYLSSEGYFKFTFKDFADSDDIRFFIADNHGKSREQFLKIKRKNISKNKKVSYTQNNVKPITVNPKAWNAITVDSAISFIYDSQVSEKAKTLFKKNDKKYMTAGSTCLTKECLIDTNYPVIVSIESEIALRSIAILSTSTPKPLLAFVQILNNGQAYLKLPFKLEKSGKIFFIGKGKDNKLYHSKAHEITMVRGEDLTSQNIYFYLENKNIRSIRVK